VLGEQPARWGYHRLTDHWARRLVERAHTGHGDLVLDIGAGDGAITRPLAATGARVLAIEAHPRRARQLRDAFAGHNVKVIRADAADLRLPGRPFVVVANPPFAITTALLKRLLHPRSGLDRAFLVLPRPVAARWTKGRAPGAQRWAQVFDLRIIATIPRSAFVPSAPREAVVLEILRRQKPR
jgi:23S rRNA (adenine-N6)-dimethyltransferase